MTDMKLAFSIGAISEDIQDTVNSLAEKVESLLQHTDALQERLQTTRRDVAVQVDAGFTPLPSHKDIELQATRPFSFTQPHQFPNWAKLRSVNVEQLVADNDTRRVLALFDDVVNIKLQPENDHLVTELNVLKVIRICQLVMQHQRWLLVQQHKGLSAQLPAQTKLAADSAAAALMVPSLNLQDVGSQLLQLQEEVSRLVAQNMVGSGATAIPTQQK